MTTKTSMTVRGWRGCLAAGIALTLAGCDAPRSLESGSPAEDMVESHATVDLRPFFEENGLPVRRQGARPTCSSFTVTGALEYAWARRTGQGIPLSVQFVNWAADEATGEHEDGSFFTDLWTGYAAFGICAEADEPYRAAYDPKWRPRDEVLAAAAKRGAAALRIHWIKDWNVETGLTDEELAAIKQVLADGWPVCGGFRWPKEAHWTDGVLDMAPPEGVRDGHSVLLVGYRDDPALPGGGAFLLRDSGKRPRGDSMSFEFARAYMNDAMWIDPAPSH